MKDEMQELREIVQKAEAIVESDIDWDIKFYLIFSDNIKGRAKQLLKALNLNLKYYDPDSSYEDDTRAYVEALSELSNKLNKIKL